MAIHDRFAKPGENDVEAGIIFLDASKLPPPRELLINLSFRPNLWPEQHLKQNFTYELIHGIPVRDIRPHVDQLSLDREGFVLMKSNVKLDYSATIDEDTLRESWAPGIKEELTNLLGAKAVYFSECLIRKPGHDGNEFSKAIPVAHIDYTRADIERQVLQLGGPNASKLLDRRIESINMWKPLEGPVRDNCLALCDASSFDIETQARKGSTVYPEGVQQNYRCMHNDQQRWYYLHDQQPDEVWVFNSGKTPHASFYNPLYAEGKTKRVSIEVRAIVIY